MNNKNVRFRHIRVTETVKDVFGNKKGKRDHVLTLATRLEGDKLYIGYSLNRVERIVSGHKTQDKYDAEYGRIRAEGRLNSSKPLVITVHPDKPMIDNIIQGLLALPTTDSEKHAMDAIGYMDINNIPSVPSALKTLLRKSVKEYKNKSNNK